MAADILPAAEEKRMADIELQAFREASDSGPTPETTIQPSLPPTDGGKDAYLVLASCIVLEALVWGKVIAEGFPYAFGVFQVYYKEREFPTAKISSIAAIGTTATGLMYFLAPFVYAAIKRYPEYRKICGVIGFIILLVGLVGASFAKTVTQLLFTQGILYAIGGAIHYFPTYLYIDEWFVRRRGFAWGTFIAGAGAAGVVLPLTMEWLLNKWGFRAALRIWAVVCVILTAPALYFMKPRLADQHADRGPRKVELGFLGSWAFWILQVGNIIQSLGNFMPSLYMPSFAVARGWSPLTGTIAVSICSAANVIGATFVGWLVDRYHVTTAINICVVGTVFAVFVFWSFAVHPAVLYTFAVIYGTFAGGFNATWSGCTHAVRQRHPVETGMIVALFTAGKGIGSVISGPLSGALVMSDSWKGRAGFAYGSGYGYLIVFSGVTASFASIGWVGKKCGVV